MPQIEQGLKLLKSWLSKMQEAQNAFKKLGNRLKAGEETTKPTQYTAVLKNPGSPQPTIKVYKKRTPVGEVILETLNDQNYEPGSLGVHYLTRTQKNSLGKGELFQQIGLEAARQYASSLGKKLVTGRNYAHNPVTQVKAVTEGFELQPTKVPLTTDARPDFDSYQRAVKNLLVNQYLRNEKSLREINSDYEHMMSDYADGTQGWVSIQAVPGMYDLEGKLDLDYADVFPEIDDFLESTSLPGFYASYVVKPKIPMSVKFKKNGPFNYLKMFK